MNFSSVQKRYCCQQWQQQAVSPQNRQQSEFAAAVESFSVALLLEAHCCERVRRAKVRIRKCWWPKWTRTTTTTTTWSGRRASRWRCCASRRRACAPRTSCVCACALGAASRESPPTTGCCTTPPSTSTGNSKFKKKKIFFKLKFAALIWSSGSECRRCSWRRCDSRKTAPPSSQASLRTSPPSTRLRFEKKNIFEFSRILNFEFFDDRTSVRWRSRRRSGWRAWWPCWPKRRPRWPKRRPTPPSTLRNPLQVNFRFLKGGFVNFSNFQTGFGGEGRVGVFRGQGWACGALASSPTAATDAATPLFAPPSKAQPVFNFFLSQQLKSSEYDNTVFHCSNKPII